MISSFHSALNKKEPLHSSKSRKISRKSKVSFIKNGTYQNPLNCI